MIIDVECPKCNGMGEVCGVNPNRRSRFVGMDDLSPDDYATQCPKCLGSGTVERDMNDGSRTGWNELARPDGDWPLSTPRRKGRRKRVGYDVGKRMKGSK